MNIRTIEESDLDTIAEFEKEIVIVSFEEEAIVDLRFHRKKLAESLAKEREGMLVATEGAKILGWIWMSRKTDYLSRKTYANLKSIYVCPEARGTDCANLLMRAGLKFAESVDAIKIISKVNVKNAPVQGVFKRYGFEPVFMTMECDLAKAKS